MPTSAGQIGVNPVESDLGNPETYIGAIYGTDTLYITPVDTGTKVSPKALGAHCTVLTSVVTVDWG